VVLIQKSQGIVWRRRRQRLRPTPLAQPTETAAVFGCLQQTVSQSVSWERETRTISCVTKVVDVTTIYSHLKRSLSYSYTFCTQCEFSIVRAHRRNREHYPYFRFNGYKYLVILTITTADLRYQDATKIEMSPGTPSWWQVCHFGEDR